MEFNVTKENERTSLKRKLPSPSTVERLKVRPLPPPEPGQQLAPLPVTPQQQPNNRELWEAEPGSSGSLIKSNSPNEDPNYQGSKLTSGPKNSNGTSDRATTCIYGSMGSTVKKTFKLDEKYKQICRCGEKLVWTKAEDCYPTTKHVTWSVCRPKAKPEVTSRVVSCDICKKSMRKTNFVYHCVRPSALHPTGYDVCGPCIIERTEKKQLVKEQLKNNPALQFCRTRGQLLELALRQDALEVDVTGIVMKRPPNSGRFGTKKCYYTVKVDTGAYAWTIPYRYSEFLALHENLQKMERCVCIGLGRKLPKFPKKPLVSLGKTKKKKNERMTAFRTYLEGLVQNKDIRDDPNFYLFLCSKPSIVVRKNTIDDILVTEESTKGMVYQAYQKTTYL